MGTFYEDVIAKDPRVSSEERCADPLLLEPVTRQAALAIGVALEALEPGRWGLYETFRSMVRQHFLFLAKKSKKDRVGVHHFGCAFDYVRRDDRGRWTWAGDFSVLGRLAAEHGMVWGGAWTSLHDGPHIQRVAIGHDQEQLLAQKWYPPADYRAGM